ncbi:TPA: hypothetical protein ACQ2HY_003318 [Klebsiella pneumoniae]
MEGSNENILNKGRFQYLIDTAFYSDSEYLIHETGFYRKAKTKDDETPYWQLLHENFVYPVGLYQSNPSDKINMNDRLNETYVRVRYLSVDKNKIKEIILTHPDYSNIIKSKLRLAGWIPPVQNEKMIQVAINNALKRGQEDYIKADGTLGKAFVESKLAYTTKGWVKTENNDWIHIRETNEQYVGTTKGFSVIEGSAEIQIAVFKEMMRRSPQVCLYVLAMAAAYCRGRIRKTMLFSPMIVFYGEAGKGKTSMYVRMSSVECRPQLNRTLITNYTTTSVAFEKKLADSTSGFYCIDEIDMMGGKGASGDLAENILNICNGIPRSKHDSDIGFTEGYSYDLIMFALSNTSIIDLVKGHKKEEAVSSRLLEIDINDPLLHNFVDVSIDEMERWDALLLENHGHLRGLYVDYIAKNHEKLNDAMLTYENELENNRDYQAIKNDHRKKQILALLHVGADIVSEVFGEEYGQLCLNTVQILQDRYSKKNDIANVENIKDISLLSNLKHWISQNVQNFVWKNYAYTESSNGNPAHEQQEHAKYLSNKAYNLKDGCFGVIKLNRPMKDELDFDGTIQIFGAGQANLEKNQINAVILKRVAEKYDLIEKDKNKQKLAGKDVKTKKEQLKVYQDLLSSSGTYSTCFILTDYSEFLKIDEEETIVEESADIDEKAIEQYSKQHNAVGHELIDNFDQFENNYDQAYNQFQDMGLLDEEGTPPLTYKEYK